MAINDSFCMTTCSDVAMVTRCGIPSACIRLRITSPERLFFTSQAIRRVASPVSKQYVQFMFCILSKTSMSHKAALICNNISIPLSIVIKFHEYQMETVRFRERTLLIWSILRLWLEWLKIAKHVDLFQYIISAIKVISLNWLKLASTIYNIIS